MLPITKTIEKCMLPVGRRPVIDYVVQDCIKAGIKEFYFVVGEQNIQLQNYYRSNIPLNDYLKRNGKHEMLDLIAPLKGVGLHFIVQPSQGKYGTAIPVALASEYVDEGESVLVVGGDDFFYNEDGSSEMKRLVEGTPEGESAILGAVLSDDDTITGRYGSIEEDSEGYLIQITEHPDKPPRPFIKNVSKYALSYDMLMSIKRYADTHKESGEYYIFTPFEEMISSGHKMKLVKSRGRYLDCGMLDNWLYANNVVCGADIN